MAANGQKRSLAYFTTVPIVIRRRPIRLCVVLEPSLNAFEDLRNSHLY